MSAAVGLGADNDCCPCCRLGVRGRWGAESEWIQRALTAIPDLTDREREVFDAMTCGPTNEDLAASLGMAIRTVKFHLENLRGKLGGISRIQTCLLAVYHQIAACPAGHV
ncbi:LuxR C-terminal-related transcriptional regulator [Streptomyces sp. NPDC091371]|uniref:helix-turn-helix domain-containing protein n=1 Tax=Streptomyces sp. NPDC091371 TaxID=3155303 RepID=UPI003446F5C8